jgi:DNA-binding Lrp family transcriptional regulator
MPAAKSPGIAILLAIFEPVAVRVDNVPRSKDGGRPMSASAAIPTEHNEATNARILAVSEDKIQGFVRYPFQAIAEHAELPLEVVVERIRAMLEAGVIRRVRQTLLANKLAEGALVAWTIKDELLDQAFEFMSKEDPFSGHVVVRSTDRNMTGGGFKLWTTLKVPQGESLNEHASALVRLTGADEFVLMPAKGIFALGVGHVRRKELEPGDRSDGPAKMMTTAGAELTPEEWNVLISLKTELSPAEIGPDPWKGRAERAGVDFETFCRIAEGLDKKQVIGRFSTFLEHVKPSAAGVKVTKFNGLFHWRVPEGMQERAGSEVGRHHIMTHCYWREGGPRFGNVNIMGVVHGTDKAWMLEHKAAIDKHLADVGIPVLYDNVFWGGRSEIKPSEIDPAVYREWHAKWAGKSHVIG